MRKLQVIKVLFVDLVEGGCTEQTIFSEDLKYIEKQKEIQILSTWNIEK